MILKFSLEKLDELLENKKIIVNKQCFVEYVDVVGNKHKVFAYLLEQKKNIMLSDINKITFLFKNDYEKYLPKLKNKNIELTYLGKKNKIKNIVHQTTCENLSKILESNSLLLPSLKKNLTQGYNEGTLKRKLISFKNFDKKKHFEYSHEIDGIYFRVKFEIGEFFKDEEINKCSAYIFFKSNILDKYDWYLNEVDSFGIPSETTYFKDQQYFIDSEEFFFNKFELVIPENIYELKKFIDYICVSEKNYSLFKKKFPGIKFKTFKSEF
jgi:hypothetical protein